MQLMANRMSMTVLSSSNWNFSERTISSQYQILAIEIPQRLRHGNQELSMNSICHAAVDSSMSTTSRRSVPMAKDTCKLRIFDIDPSFNARDDI